MMPFRPKKKSLRVRVSLRSRKKAGGLVILDMPLVEYLGGQVLNFRTAVMPKLKFEVQEIGGKNPEWQEIE